MGADLAPDSSPVAERGGGDSGGQKFSHKIGYS